MGSLPLASTLTARARLTEIVRHHGTLDCAAACRAYAIALRAAAARHDPRQLPVDVVQANAVVCRHPRADRAARNEFSKHRPPITLAVVVRAVAPAQEAEAGEC